MVATNRSMRLARHFRGTGLPGPQTCSELCDAAGGGASPEAERSASQQQGRRGGKRDGAGGPVGFRSGCT